MNTLQAPRPVHGDIYPDIDQIAEAFRRTRELSTVLVHGLTEGDVTAQSMEDASPAKWHLAHTTWFFERFILRDTRPRADETDHFFDYLFNSYYDAVGRRHPRHERGLLTRPTLPQILDYRARVDEAMADYLVSAGRPALALVELGIAHEQQHQELLLTDLLHLFSRNPLLPAFATPSSPSVAQQTMPLSWHRFEGGIERIGHDSSSFCFDCETPPHDRLISPFELANRCVTNGEYLEFMEDGGYSEPAHWLADGYAATLKSGWSAPLYWHQQNGEWQTMTLHGPATLEMSAPVTHISFFEADAFARWSGARLPREEEWEYAAGSVPLEGNFLQSGHLCPIPQGIKDRPGFHGLFGDVWEWTSSAFAAYPGFAPSPGAVGEYNGKFMNGQMVLRGGSCVTPDRHVRRTYRNFFAPDKRWQFSGVRLARDV